MYPYTKLLAVGALLVLSGFLLQSKAIKMCVEDNQRRADFSNTTEHCSCVYKTLLAANFSDQEIEWWSELFKIPEFSKIENKNKAQHTIDKYIRDHDIFKQCSQ